MAKGTFLGGAVAATKRLEANGGGTSSASGSSRPPPSLPKAKPPSLPRGPGSGSVYKPWLGWGDYFGGGSWFVVGDGWRFHYFLAFFFGGGMVGWTPPENTVIVIVDSWGW